MQSLAPNRNSGKVVRSLSAKEKMVLEFIEAFVDRDGLSPSYQEIKEHFDVFFASPKEKVIGKYARRMAIYLGGVVKATEQLSELHDVGYLPLTVKSLPEGSKVGFGIPVMTVTNTLPHFFWLVNYLETLISDLTWKTATNATIAAEYKGHLQHFGIAQPLLHAIAQRVFVVFRLNDRDRHVRLMEQDIVCSFILSSGVKLTSDYDTSLGERKLFTYLCDNIPSSLLKRGRNKFRADVPF